MNYRLTIERIDPEQDLKPPSADPRWSLMQVQPIPATPVTPGLLADTFYNATAPKPPTALCVWQSFGSLEEDWQLITNLQRDIESLEQCLMVVTAELTHVPEDSRHDYVMGKIQMAKVHIKHAIEEQALRRHARQAARKGTAP